MDTTSALKMGWLSLFAVTALFAISNRPASADQASTKLAEDCIFSFMEDPCRHAGQAHAMGPIKVADVQSRADQTPKKLAADCLFSFMEDPCRHVGYAYVSGPIQAQGVTVQPQIDQTQKKLAEGCVFSFMEDPCRHQRPAPVVEISKY